MSRILAVMNSAGGVGRTTSAHCLAVAFSEYGRKVLMVDCDPQGALTFTLGKERSLRTVYDIFSGRERALAMIHQTHERVDLIPSSPKLSQVTRLKSTEVLFAALEKLSQDQYDIIIIDSAAGFSELNQCVLAAADEVIIPTRLDLLSIRGALQIAQASKSSRAKVRAVLPTMVEARSKHGIEMMDELKSQFGKSVIDPGIPKSPLILEAAVAGQSLLTFKKASDLAGRFREITYDLL